jgi:hypothetical protein
MVDQESVKLTDPAFGMLHRVVKVDAASEEDAWTQEQQKQLEAGLVSYPASIEKNER